MYMLGYKRARLQSGTLPEVEGCQDEEYGWECEGDVTGTEISLPICKARKLLCPWVSKLQNKCVFFLHTGGEQFTDNV